MDKDEALKLASALDHWATQTDMGRKPDPKSLIRKASAELRRLQAELDAIKQAPPARPAPVQEPVAWIDCKVQMPPPGVRVFFLHKDYDRVGFDTWCGDDFRWTPSHWMPIPPLTTTPPAAQPALVQNRSALTLDRPMTFGGCPFCGSQSCVAGQCRSATPPAQPAVPDAMTSADIQEHIEYVAGWNDCRQAMMEMMK